MKEFNIQNGEGEFIIHIAGDNSKYTVTYDHGQITFQNAGLKYIIPENLGHYATFFTPDPNTGKRKYLLNNVRDLYRDTTPTDFGLGNNIDSAEINSSHFTDEIVIGGINESIPVIAPSGVIIYVNGNAVSSGTEVDNGDVVKFEIIANSTFETTDNYNLTIGDITKSFSITTEIGVRPSCLAWLNSGFNTDGIYKISPDGINTYDMYCDMTTDGGGWTLILGGGTKYNKTHNFWNGTSGVSENHYFNGYRLNTQGSENAIKNLPFTQLMLSMGNDKPRFSASDGNTTFVSKKSTQPSWSGGGDSLNELIWNKSDRDAYTYADFLLGGRRTNAAAYGDYYYYGIGVSAWASSLTTNHSWANGIDTNASTGYVTGTYNYSIADIHHRSASGNYTHGMLIR